MDNIAIIVYGDGGELGSFEIFAMNLKREISKKYTKVVVKYINRDTDFFQLIGSIDPNKEKISELHVFSHAIGAGLFLGYKDRTISLMRNALVSNKFKAGKKVSYNDVVKTEVGAIQTDDFKVGKLATQKSFYQSRFSANAFIKLWGCNSGVSGWVYSDGSISDPNDTSVAYYWRAFNKFNTPKPSIAKSLASYFNRKVYGANSGASIEVKHKGNWVSTKEYKNNVGH